MPKATFVRKTVSAIGVSVAALALFAAPASAAVSASTRTGAAPDALSSGSGKSFGRIVCEYGQLCVLHNGGYEVFTKCQRVYLSYWTGSGALMNNQTTGTISRFYDVHGKEIVSLRSKAYDPGHGVDWDPVWSIQVC